MKKDNRTTLLARLLWFTMFGILFAVQGAAQPVAAADLEDDETYWLNEGVRPPLENGLPVETPSFLEKTSPVDAASVGLTIDIWYGDEQRFGHNGEPIRWINIFGNVQSDGNITSLAYSLNGQSYKSLDMGPTERRLADPGDFNVEIAYSALQAGESSVSVRAQDSLGRETTETILVEYDAGNTWTLPYVADWSEVSSIEEAAQVVDGLWDIVDGKLRPIQFDYDRLVSIGDIGWTEYEVTVPVTIHEIDDEGGFGGKSVAPGVGMIQRWQGHFCWDEAEGHPRTDAQLCNGWQELGTLDWFTWSKDCGGAEYCGGLQRIGALGAIDPNVAPQKEITYLMKGQVEQGCGDLGYYRFKVWEIGQPEPNDWNMKGCGKTNEPYNPPTAGSLLLVAHHVDASFGPVTVTELNVGRPKLTLGSNGNGSAGAQPEYPDYTYLESVTVSATPANGYAFSHWSGDLPVGSTSTDNPLSFQIIEDTVLTANFVVASEYTLTTNTMGQGSVTESPDKAVYLFGETVNLEASPEVGWAFDHWEIDLSGTNPIESLLMVKDSTVMAVFEQIRYEITAIASLEDGTPAPQAGTVEVSNPNQSQGYVYDEIVQLQANAAPGWEFVEWRGDKTGTTNPDTLTIQGDTNLTAVFRQIQYQLQIDEIGLGTVTAMPPGPYTYGQTVILEAYAAQDWAFEEWRIDGIVSGASNPLDVSIQGNTAVSATFELITVELLSLVNGEGDIMAMPPGPYDIGQTVELTANPAVGWAFTEWSSGLDSAENPVEVIIQSDMTIIATFVRKNPTFYLPLIHRN